MDITIRHKILDSISGGYIFGFTNEQRNAMKTTCQNEQVVSLITRAFDNDGMLVSKGKRKNQAEARAILDSGVNVYGTYVGEYDAHNSLLIITYPNKTI